MAKSLIDEQRRADRARTFREVNDNSELMALAASREAYEEYERDELKRQERELRRLLLANEGLSGLLELFIENEIDDDALAHVSVEDLVEIGVPAAAARRILSK